MMFSSGEDLQVNYERLTSLLGIDKKYFNRKQVCIILDFKFQKRLHDRTTLGQVGGH